MELMDIKQLHKLAHAAANNTPLTFSLDGGTETHDVKAVNAVLREQLREMTKDYYTYKRNENTIFQLISEELDEVLPVRVAQQFEQFADVRTVAQGDKAVFRLRITDAARKRAKAFVTRVGLAGRYETMMLEGRELEVGTYAIGYAVRLGFEEFLDGRYDFSDFIDVAEEGMNEYIYNEIAKALTSIAKDKSVPAVNTYVGAGFDEGKMDELLGISDSYGNGASTIYCTREFAATMLPQDKYVSDQMRNSLWDQGYLGDYKGHSVVILRQSIDDASNTHKAIDPAYAYILPSIGEKPVKVVFEGQTAVRNVSDNDDWSQDIQTYKKVGVAVFSSPAICTYQNTNLKQTIA